MKTIANYEQSLGDGGGKASANIGIEESSLVAKVQIEYPLTQVVEPATKAFDAAMDRLEAAIPGDWDKPMIADVKAKFKEELVKFIAE